MKKDEIKIGTTYNYLTIINEPYRVKVNGHYHWLVKCKCVCGNIIETRLGNLGRNKSCGCYNRKAASDRISKYNKESGHGLVQHPLYNSWKGMKRKCYNKNSIDYLGGNIIVCDTWKDSVQSFYDWAINKWFEGAVLSRIDNNRNFEPDNCCFRTKADVIRGNINTQKARQTYLAKYGVSHPMKIPSVVASRRETFLKKYGKPFGFYTNGKEQKGVGEFLLSNGYEFKEYYLKDGKEIDLYNEQLKIGIEYCGLYWHNEQSKHKRERTYHFDKYKQAEAEGIRLITIFSDEWLTRQHQVKNYLKSVLGVTSNSIYARKCDVAIIDVNDGNKFINENHIQKQNKKPCVCFGIKSNGCLLGVMSLSRHHRINNSSDIVLDRLCFLDGIRVIGGSSKLLNIAMNWCAQHDIKKIITWSDNRWSRGDVYNKIGFIKDKELGPDYTYVRISRPTERIPKQRMMKSNIGCPEGLTEAEYCKQLGYARIWDCGKVRYIKEGLSSTKLAALGGG